MPFYSIFAKYAETLCVCVRNEHIESLVLKHLAEKAMKFHPIIR